MDDLRIKTGVKRRRLFGPADDKRLESIVLNHEFNGWKGVAKLMPGFTPKQLRDRWHNYISPKNSFGPWTPEEDQIIIQKIKEFGTKWSLISTFLNGRSDNCVKNRWNTVLKEDYLANPMKYNQPIAQIEYNQPTQEQNFTDSKVITMTPQPMLLPTEPPPKQQLFLDKRFVEHFFETVPNQ